jgi:hypothetical protein
MKPYKLLLIALVFVFATSAFAQTSTPPNTSGANQAAVTTQPAASTADIQTLKDGLAAAQRQIQALQDELHRRDQAVEHAQVTAADAAAKAEAAQQQAAQQQQTMGDLQSAVADLKSVSATSFEHATLKNAVLNVDDSGQAATQAPEQQVLNQQMESPVTIRFRGINITPGGYSEAAFVRREHALGADLPTPFNSIPEPGASQNQLSEFFGSGRQSKISTFVNGRVGNVDLSSYVSADFLSAGVTSTSTQTNSYTLRLRQAWAQAKFTNGWSFLGGQAWSLVTEDAKGISPDDDLGKTNDVRPKTIDPSYNVGFDFARQWGIRVTKSFGDKVAFAFALENPQATVTTHGNANLTVGATTVVTPTGTTTVGGTAYYNFLVGQAGASNSYNTTGTYGFNPSPDIIAKVAFDPGFGHYEIYGLATRFTGRVFPCVEQWTAAGGVCNPTASTSPSASELALLAYNSSKEGGGVGASARWNFFNKRITFGLKGFGGSGVGRYAPGGLPDASINPDGTIHLVKNLHGLGTLEWHSKKLDVYSYGGVEYAARSWGFDNTILPGATSPVGYVGYGAPGFNNSGCYSEAPPTASNGFTPGGTGKCIGDTRALVEGTLGFWYKFYSGERGRFQFGTQYSYVARNVWSGNDSGKTGGLEPGGIDSMIFTSFRYYLP